MDRARLYTAQMQEVGPAQPFAKLAGIHLRHRLVKKQPQMPTMTMRDRKMHGLKFAALHHGE